MKRADRLRWMLLVLSLPLSCGTPARQRATAPAPAEAQREATSSETPHEAPLPPTLPKGPDWLHVPEGFTVELVAGPPLVERPIMASFDDRGRLYVADSAGVNLRGPELQKDPPHRIVMLEDTNGDGRFDKSSLFADKIVFPQGILWHNGAVFVASPPSLWKFEDMTGDGVCDSRIELITGFPITGVSDDVHGACLGPDGRIYTCCGRFDYKLTNIEGKVFAEGRQPVLVRCRPNGADAEVVSGLQGNGVEVAWTDEGDAFVSGTFFSDAYARNSGEGDLRDALIQIIEGGDYPVRGHPQSAHWMKSTGDLLPAMYPMIATAPSGLMRYKGSTLGREFENNLLCAIFNTHKVMRHVLERDGATFHSRNEDFLTSTNTDFHPTDVFQDADGSLLVVDTGGWFRIGCPTSVTAKPDIKGGIYRIRRTGMPKIEDPRGLKMAWDKLSPQELTFLLDDPRPAVRDHAIAQVAKRSPGSVPWLAEVLQKGTSPAARRNAIWALTRIHRDSARSAVRTALNDTDEGVRQAAAYSVGLFHGNAANDRLIEMVTTDTPAVRREAANALGRADCAKAVPALLSALRGNTDRFLDHALIYALIRIAEPDATARGLADTDVTVRRGALIALDQMGSDKLTPDVVRPLLDPAEPLLQKAALHVIARHTDWGEAMRGYFRDALARPIPQDAKREELKQQLIAFATASDTRALIGDRLRDDATSPEVRLLLLETVAQTPLEVLPDAWGDGIRKGLSSSDDRVVRQAILAARSAPPGRKPSSTRVDKQIDFPDGHATFGKNAPQDNFAARWTGSIRIAREGTYSFTLESDDGSRLLIDGALVVNNPGQHPMQAKSGDAHLTAGDHELRFDYFQAGNSGGCRLLWESDGTRQVVPPSVLMHRGKEGAEPTPGLFAQFFRMGGLGNDFPDLGVNDFDGPLLGIARDTSRGTEVRVEALVSVGPRLNPIDPGLLDLLLESLGPSKPTMLRSAAADATARLKLNVDQRRRLIPVTASAGPLEMPRLLAAFENDTDPDTGRRLIAALNDSASAKALRPEALARAIGKYPDDVRQLAEPLLKRSSPDLDQQKARLAELEPVLAGGDGARGRALFFSAKAACSACHAISDNGGHIGPDLSKIAAIRTGRDLLEAIVFPSASFARGFEPVMIKTKDGDIESGIITRETADAIYLTTGPREVKRLPRAGIADVRQGTVSIMPQGLDTQLSRQELADLIAFLSGLK